MCFRPKLCPTLILQLISCKCNKAGATKSCGCNSVGLWCTEIWLCEEDYVNRKPGDDKIECTCGAREYTMDEDDAEDIDYYEF